MSPRVRILLVTLATLGLCNGTHAKPPAQAVAPVTEESKPGVVIVVCGIGGLDFVALSSHWALP